MAFTAIIINTRQYVSIIHQNYAFFCSSAMFNRNVYIEIYTITSVTALNITPQNQLNSLKYILTIAFLLLLIVPNSIAQQRFEGFLRHETGALISDNGDFLFSRNVAQFDLNSAASGWDLKLSLQLRQNLVDGNYTDIDFRLREAYIDWFTDNLDIRIGRQMLVWGRSEASQINDILTPFDLSEFLTQDFTDLRQGITAASFTYFIANNSFQMVLIPVHERSILPQPGTRWDFFPDLDFTFQNDNRPQANIKNIQYALRWSNRSSLNFDLDAGFFYGFYSVPSLQKELRQGDFSLPEDIFLNYTYLKSPAFMISAAYRLSNNFELVTESTFWLQRDIDTFPELFSSEKPVPVGDLLDAIDFYNETGFLTQKPFLASMLGFQTSALNWQIALQYQSDYIIRHQSDIIQDEFYQSATITATRSVYNDLIQLRLLSRYQLNGNDFWINPDFGYDVLDGLNFNVGLHYFNGREPDDLYGHLSFYNYRKNSFGYVKLTAYW